jgi:hypothetical protein
MASSAAALCPVPNISDDATVLKFRSGAVGESQGAFGGKSSFSARTAGALYYDHGAKSLRLCDGSDWRSVQAELPGGEGAGSGGMTPGQIETINFSFTNTSSTSGKSVNYTMPIDLSGSYSLYAEIDPTGKKGRCTVYLEAPGKTPVSLVTASNDWDRDDGTTDASGNASWGLTSKNPSQYAFSYDHRSSTYTGDNGGAGRFSHLAKIGGLNWSGKVKVSVNSGYSYNDSRGDRDFSASGCSGQIKALRTS